MTSRQLRTRLAAAVLLIAPAPLLAQTPAIPSAAQAQQMLQTNPQLIQRLQAMMAQSGMSPEEIRNRLMAQGYPASLLDQYLPGGAVADSSALPSEQSLLAIRALGLGDTLAVDSMVTTTRARRRNQFSADSAFLDSLTRAMKDDTLKAAMRAVFASRTARKAALDSGFKVFGLDLFKRDDIALDPNAISGVDPNYRFGTGDRVTLFITGDVEKTHKLQVGRDGFVVIPQVGRLQVAGLTRAQFDDELYRELGRVYAGVRRSADARTHFYVEVPSLGSNQVFVHGDVDFPGSYKISRAGTIITAVYQAGGPTTNGSMREIQVKRGGQLVGSLDLYDYALRGDASNDIRLESGDVVFIPPRGGQVRVAGDVLRPATYELKPNETIADVIRMAGGFASDAEQRRVVVERVLPVAERTTAGSDRTMLDVPASLFASTAARGGDVVHVDRVASRVANRVTVTGNVFNPGVIAFTAGMKVSDAVRRSGGLKPDTYLEQILVNRLRPDSTREVRRTSATDTSGKISNDFTLVDGDEVEVFSMTDFRPKRYITISGAVNKPGQIAYREGMTLRDAVLIAGGLKEGALLTEAEVSHLPNSRASGVTAVSQRVALDSSYLFDRGHVGRYAGPPGVPVQAGVSPDFELRPYDAVTILQQPDFQLQRSVAVYGEVKYPGNYALTKKDEKLSSVIARAGGLTDRAFANGIVFVRVRDTVGRIGVNLPEVLKNDRSDDNLTLVDRDSIFIPPYVNVVSVRGAVYSPLSVAFVPGANIDYYISAAGGGKPKADLGRAYVTQASGKVETRHRVVPGWTSNPEPTPGSTVIVPEKDPADHHDYFAIASAVTSILGSLVAIVAILKR